MSFESGNKGSRNPIAILSKYAKSLSPDFKIGTAKAFEDEVKRRTNETVSEFIIWENFLNILHQWAQSNGFIINKNKDFTLTPEILSLNINGMLYHFQSNHDIKNFQENTSSFNSKKLQWRDYMSTESLNFLIMQSWFDYRNKQEFLNKPQTFSCFHQLILQLTKDHKCDIIIGSEHDKFFLVWNDSNRKEKFITFYADDLFGEQINNFQRHYWWKELALDEDGNYCVFVTTETISKNLLGLMDDVWNIPKA